MDLGDLTRDGRVRIFKEMIDEEIGLKGGLESLKEKVEKRWPARNEQIFSELLERFTEYKSEL